jgi:TrmH family RNA methyltransferase
MSIITSRRHRLVADCRAIVRGDDARLLLDGWHLLADALSAGLRMDWVAVDASRPPADPSLLEGARASGALVAQVTAAVMDALSPVRSASGIVAVCPRPAIEPAALVAPAPALVLAAFGVQDPGNVGAIVRSVDAAGATGVLLDHETADPWSWKALRASMGSTFRVPVYRDDTARDRVRAWRRQGLRVIAADSREGVSMYDMPLTDPIVLALGAEGAGVPDDVLALADARVRIPMRARVDSLNVAVAAALLAYEARRQRSARS